MVFNSGQRHLIFVYGTMKRGMRNHSRIMDSKNTQFLGTTRTLTNTHELNTFITADGYVAPALIDGGCRIHGEVYEIDDNCLSILDMCEGEGYVYERRPISAVGYAPRALQAYYYVRDLTGRNQGRDKIVSRDGNVLSFEDRITAND